MNESVKINFRPFKDRYGTEHVIITNVESDAYFQEFIVPDNINGSHVALLENESLLNLKASLVVIPEAITLGENVFSDNLETLFLSDGIIPLNIDLALSSKNTEIFFPYICPEYVRLDRLGYKVSCATMPIYTIVPNKANKKKQNKNKDKDREIEELTLARTFFERGISAHLENKPIDELYLNDDKEPGIDADDVPDINDFTKFDDIENLDNMDGVSFVSPSEIDEDRTI